MARQRFCITFFVVLFLASACTTTAETQGDNLLSPDESSSSSPSNAASTSDGESLTFSNADVGEVLRFTPLGVHETIPPIEGTDAGSRCLSVFGTVEALELGDFNGHTTTEIFSVLAAQSNGAPVQDYAPICVGVLEELGPLGYHDLSRLQIAAGDEVGFYISYGNFEGEITEVAGASRTDIPGTIDVEIADPPDLVGRSTPASDVAPLANAVHSYGDFWTIRPHQIIELEGGGPAMKCYAVTATAIATPYETGGEAPEWSDNAAQVGAMSGGAYVGVQNPVTIEWFAYQFGGDARAYPAPSCATDPVTEAGWLQAPSTLEFDTDIDYFSLLTIPAWVTPEELIISVPWAGSPGRFSFDVETEILPPPS